MSEKLHFYLFSYAFLNGVGSTTLGLSRRVITIAAINEAKREVRKSLPDITAIAITGATYLGYLSKEEFMDEDAE